MPHAVVLHVAVPSPLRRLFDYRPAHTAPACGWCKGIRVRVPFGNRAVIGIVMAVDTTSELPYRQLKPVADVLDDAPLPEDWLSLCEFTARYYHYPLGDTLAHALPKLLRQGRALEAQTRERWYLTTALPDGTALSSEIRAQRLGRAARQQMLLALLEQHPHGMLSSAVMAHGFTRQQLAGLEKKGLARCAVECVTGDTAEHRPLVAEPALPLNREQGAALAALHQVIDEFAPVLLHGITGSGKTEVYLQLIEAVLRRGKQALVLVPEIGLTPQTLSRFRHRFNTPIAVMHSNMSDGERLDGWEAARSGRAKIVIGTRSAIFTPMQTLGAIIIDEEHDSSFKQQDTLRYNARDLALVRGQCTQIPVVLGSATPSLETLLHARQGRYRYLTLTQRPGSASPAALELVDLRIGQRRGGIGAVAFNAIRRQLDAGHQVLVFINRRGFAPTLSCQSCGHIFECSRCDARMTYHRQPPMLLCHHCDHRQAIPEACPICQSGDIRPLGAGTERCEETLAEAFPEARILRIDRDSMRRRHALAEALDEIKRNEPCLLVGTQILAKGHHFPHVTLVVVVNADGSLYSADFRAPEHMAQLLIQVAGRTGRAALPGQVLIQTMHPEDPLLTTLTAQGYAALADQLLEERRAAQLPPFHHMALLRVEGAQMTQVMALAQEVADTTRQYLEHHRLPAQCMGPSPAPMERRQNRYHVQLLITSAQRRARHHAVAYLIHTVTHHPLARRCRWSVDIDPHTMG